MQQLPSARFTGNPIAPSHVRTTLPWRPNSPQPLLGYWVLKIADYGLFSGFVEKTCAVKDAADVHEPTVEAAQTALKLLLGCMDTPPLAQSAVSADDQTSDPVLDCWA
eukprot:5083034-Amphidinium_carterae.2